MTLYLTRDIDLNEEDEAEAILWEVGENDPLPELREDGHWFSDTLQALFPLTEHLVVQKGQIIRVHLTTTRPKHRTQKKRSRPGRPRRSDEPRRRPEPSDNDAAPALP